MLNIKVKLNFQFVTAEHIYPFYHTVYNHFLTVASSTECTVFSLLFLPRGIVFRCFEVIHRLHSIDNIDGFLYKERFRSSIRQLTETVVIFCVFIPSLWAESLRQCRYPPGYAESIPPGTDKADTPTVGRSLLFSSQSGLRRYTRKVRGVCSLYQNWSLLS